MEVIKNLSAENIIELEELQINEFHPLQNGEGKPTQVHICTKVKGLEDTAMFVIRLKSKRVMNELIAALEKHKDSVWPED